MLDLIKWKMFESITLNLFENKENEHGRRQTENIRINTSSNTKHEYNWIFVKINPLTQTTAIRQPAYKKIENIHSLKEAFSLREKLNLAKFS